MVEAVGESGGRHLGPLARARVFAGCGQRTEDSVLLWDGRTFLDEEAGQVARDDDPSARAGELAHLLHQHLLRLGLHALLHHQMQERRHVLLLLLLVTLLLQKLLLKLKLL